MTVVAVLASGAPDIFLVCYYGLSSSEPKRAYLRLLDHSRIKVGFEKRVLQETAHYGTFFGSQTAH